MLRLQARRLHAVKAALAELPVSKTIREQFQLAENGLTVKQALMAQSKDNITLNGWIDQKPKKVGKNLTFATLRDPGGQKLQLIDSGTDLKSAGVEDVVQVVGQLVPKKRIKNQDTDTYELQVKSLQTLNKANKKPSQLANFKIDGNFPPEDRVLQLRLPKFQRNLKLRYEITKTVRSCLDSQNFTEIETPLLFKSTPEGAREFLVPSRHLQSGEPAFYALPQSPQQYKQLLMASGVSRYFQIARCFRDEDLRSDRQPEFTQVDLEMSFASGEDVMKVVGDTVSKVWKQHSADNCLKTLNRAGQIVDVTESTPIQRLSYKEAMVNYGIDKPDLRFPDLKILDLSEFKARGYTNTKFPVFEILILRNAFSDKEDLEINWSMLSDEKLYNYRVPTVIPITDEAQEVNWFEGFHPIAAFENPTILKKFLNLRKGDIVCGATRQFTHAIYENPTPLGRLRQLVTESAKGKELYQKTQHPVAAWVQDFPLFNPVEEELETSGRKQLYPVYKPDAICSTHHPFTMVKLADYSKLETDPLSCLGQHYDLVINGVEIGGGSTRIHVPELQNYIFKKILGLEKPEALFGHLLEAFAMGTPPHAGFAIGFDRMCAMICGTTSIRDVIAFPKTATGSDLVVGSPSVVGNDVLRSYHLNARTEKVSSN
ncbi:LAMI_0E08152g1_1 [Lachancea mirantina]|uniref:LAMI_0E08152g1_1 n=1 Tax=Lachancea mirantina TaxID=1230905 RepID=A0A1G4JMV1_9SACH|nr:LAMI_0E08152g1_1 [Lachancea mirantina]